MKRTFVPYTLTLAVFCVGMAFYLAFIHRFVVWVFNRTS